MSSFVFTRYNRYLSLQTVIMRLGGKHRSRIDVRTAAQWAGSITYSGGGGGDNTGILNVTCCVILCMFSRIDKRITICKYMYTYVLSRREMSRNKAIASLTCSYLHTCTTPALRAHCTNTSYDTRVIRINPEKSRRSR